MMLYVFYYCCYADGEWDIWVDDDWPITQPRDHFCNECYMMVLI